MDKFNGIESLITQRRIVSAQVNLLNRCTSRCEYCRKYTWPDDILQYDVLKDTIAYLAQQGLQTIVFSGGDPIIYPTLKQLLDYCESLNVQTSMITTLNTNQEGVLRHIATQCERIHCSVDAADRTLYAKLRGVDAFDRVKANIIKVNEIREGVGKQPIRISATISNENYNQIMALYDFAIETASTINYYFIHEHEEYFLTDDQKNTMKAQLFAVASNDDEHYSNAEDIFKGDFTKDSTNVRTTYCPIPFVHCLINANGDIYPCCKLLNDNGEYCTQDRYAYGNIYRGTAEFDNRFNQMYHIKDYCNGCEERYVPYIDEVNNLVHCKDKRCWL